MPKETFSPRVPKKPPNTADKMYPDLYREVAPLLNDDFFVLNIGANDGVDNDPIHPFLLMFRGWKGLCIEPVEYNFRQLQHNYRQFPGINLVKAAICQEQRPLYYVDDLSGCDMRYVSQCCSFDRDYVLEALSGLRERRPETVTDHAEEFIVMDDAVQCLSLPELLETWSVQQVDFLNIDVEGHDFEVFNAFDFTRYKPSIVCVETVTFTQEEKRHFKRVMADHSYRSVGGFGVFSRVYARTDPFEYQLGRTLYFDRYRGGGALRKQPSTAGAIRRRRGCGQLPRNRD